MVNALSVDLEDWFCAGNISALIQYRNWDACQSRIVKNTLRLLDLFSAHNVHATFFVLGWIAERFPELVRELELRGHEVASHGYAHNMLTRQTPTEFEADLQKALSACSHCIRQTIIGYRAPSFTVTAATMWAIPILERYGIRYDSSVFPIGFHPDYGLPSSPLAIHKISNALTELPMSCALVGGRKIPCSGGGYFRLFPYALTRYLMRTCNRQGRPVIFYVHPWEIDPDQPRLRLPLVKRLRHYNNLGRTFHRLERLLDDFSFTSIRNILGL